MPADELFKACLVCLEIGIMEPRAQVNGWLEIVLLSTKEFKFQNPETLGIVKTNH